MEVTYPGPAAPPPEMLAWVQLRLPQWPGVNECAQEVTAWHYGPMRDIELGLRSMEKVRRGDDK